ncbi:glycosyltransferase family 4 protein [Saccharopolyspora aridisoli]|uniref:glycosyltransferase family 4 protein n=1 Tax=Saccharopolyspora aridisoli TaxID=2530385 RepID=UPI001404DAF9|nr:glycosyltransferase family 4 protein [Saccharopolyspora aridisoli]
MLFGRSVARVQRSATNNRPRVVHISTAHPWEDNRILQRECRALSQSGYRVELIAGTEVEREVYGVHIHPVPPERGRFRRITRGVPRALLIARGRRADVYHLHDPELIPLAPLLRRSGASVIFDAHEDLPNQVLDKHYLPRPTRKAAAAFAKALYWFAGYSCHQVIAATNTVANRFPSHRTTVVRNYPQLRQDVEGEYADTTANGLRRNLLVYVGEISVDRGIYEMLAAMKYMPESWRLTLAGPVHPPTLLDSLRREAAWGRVDYYGHVSPGEARNLVARSRIGIVVLHPTRAYVDALPTKLLEYMAEGIPVVASDFPYWRGIVEEESCGLLVDPLDPKVIGEAMSGLAAEQARAEEMGANGRRAIVEEFNWGREKIRLLTMYRSLTGFDDICGDDDEVEHD